MRDGQSQITNHKITNHWTLAVTEASALIVNVQVLVLLPPLEHAPDQMTSRPLVALRVIDVLTAKLADPVLPTATLIPAGADVTRSPPRPVAVTVSAVFDGGGGGGGGADDGVTINDVATHPPKFALSVTVVLCETGLVVTEKLTLSDPAGTVALAGMLATALLLLTSVTTAPPDGAMPLRTTVPTDGLPPITSKGSRKKEVTLVAVGVALTVSCRVSVVAPNAVEMVTVVSAETGCVSMKNPALLLPSVNVTFGWETDAAAGLLLETDIVAVAIADAGAT